VIRIRNDRHEIHEIPFSGFLRRTFPEFPGLFVYRHRTSGNWVVARWVRERDRIAQELLIIGPSLARLSREFVSELRALLYHPVTKREFLRAASPYETASLDAAVEANDEHDFWRHRWGKKTFSVPRLWR